MISVPTFEQFLAVATGLSRERAIEVYRAGYPWPLFTTDDIRKAAILAQAKGLLLSEALAEVERSADAEHDEMLARMDEIERAKGKAYLGEKVRALASLPSIKEGLDHVREVSASTYETLSTVFRLYIAIQRYALSNPSWEPSCEAPAQFPRLVC